MLVEHVVHPSNHRRDGNEGHGANQSRRDALAISTGYGRRHLPTLPPRAAAKRDVMDLCPKPLAGGDAPISSRAG